MDSFIKRYLNNASLQAFEETEKYIKNIKSKLVSIQSTSTKTSNIHFKVGEKDVFVVVNIAFNRMVTNGVHSEFYVKKFGCSSVSEAFEGNELLEPLAEDITRGMKFEDTKEIIDEIVKVVKNLSGAKNVPKPL